MHNFQHLQQENIYIKQKTDLSQIKTCRESKVYENIKRCSIIDEIEKIFNPLIQSCTLNLNEISSNQERLSQLLTKIGSGTFLKKNL